MCGHYAKKLAKSKNKNYRLKKSGVFQFSQKHYWENFKIADHKYQF